MIATIVIALALAASVFAALSLELPSVVTTALASYLALVANLGLVTWALSPFDAVTRSGLLGAESALLVACAGAWWLRGRPVVRLEAARTGLAYLARDPVTMLFLAVVFAALAYELVLAVTVPANNYDSLTYHLSRVAAWKQAGGIHWIPNAPSDRLNEFQPLAEQQILFLFVATGSGALYALPQFVAQLAILAAVYGASRQLGFDRRVAACGAALLATFSLFALEATTAQNDLVSAAFPVAAACLLLAGGSTEAVLAGLALGLGLGVKLTTLLTWPVLGWLVWMGGRRTIVRTLAGLGGGFFAVGAWGFVENLIHTGHVLGHGGGRTDQSVSPSVVTMLHTFVRIVYRLLDLSRITNPEIWVLAGVGIAAGAVTAAVTRRRAGRPRAVAVAAAAVAVPLLSPALVLGVAPVIAWITGVLHIPVHDPAHGFSINRDTSEDFSAFGPVAALALIGAPVLAVTAHRADRRRLALALTLPSYVLLLGLYAKYNIWITRFMIVPAALSAPLFGHLLRSRAAVCAVLAVAALTVGLALQNDDNKPLAGVVGRPWNLDQLGALRESDAEPLGREVAAALVAYKRLVPAGSCVGAVLDPDEWSYPLWGPRLQNRVVLPAVARGGRDGAGGQSELRRRQHRRQRSRRRAVPRGRLEARPPRELLDARGLPPPDGALRPLKGPRRAPSCPPPTMRPVRRRLRLVGWSSVSWLTGRRRHSGPGGLP